MTGFSTQIFIYFYAMIINDSNRHKGLRNQLVTTIRKKGIKDKKVLVTGSSSGIGVATAIMFSRQRCYVGVHYFQTKTGAEKTLGQVFNIGNSVEITIEELAQRVKELSGSESELKYIPYEEAYEGGFEDMQRRCPDNSKIAKLLGYKSSISLDELIKITIDYHRELLST